MNKLGFYNQIFKRICCFYFTDSVFTKISRLYEVKDERHAEAFWNRESLADEDSLPLGERAAALGDNLLTSARNNIKFGPGGSREISFTTRSSATYKEDGEDKDMQREKRRGIQSLGLKSARSGFRGNRRGGSRGRGRRGRHWTSCIQISDNSLRWRHLYNEIIVGNVAVEILEGAYCLVGDLANYECNHESELPAFVQWNYSRECSLEIWMLIFVSSHLYREKKLHGRMCFLFSSLEVQFCFESFATLNCIFFTYWRNLPFLIQFQLGKDEENTDSNQCRGDIARNGCWSK